MQLRTRGAITVAKAVSSVVSKRKVSAIVKQQVVQKVSQKKSATPSTMEGRFLDRSAEAPYLSRHRYVIGVDEAGRGPLAGPVVTAACLVDTEGAPLPGLCVMDSKGTSENEREAAFELLTSAAGVCHCVCRVEHDEIDRLNILQATMAGMSRAVRGLLLQHPHIRPQDCVVLVDGNRIPGDLPAVADAQFVIKGDAKIYSIAAASILAKVSRDRIMEALHAEYPQYNLAKHKGYPTLEHRTLLMQHGPSAIHRYSYRPVAEAAVKHNIPFSVPPKDTPAAKGEQKMGGGKRGSKKSVDSTEVTLSTVVVAVEEIAEEKAAPKKKRASAAPPRKSGNNKTAAVEEGEEKLAGTEKTLKKIGGGRKSGRAKKSI